MIFGGGFSVSTDLSVQEYPDVVRDDTVRYSVDDYLYEAGFSATPQQEVTTPYWTLERYNQLVNGVLIGGIIVAVLLWLIARKR